MHRFAAPLDADEVVTIDNLPVTSLARTVVDLGRTLPFADAVAAADAGLRRGLTKGDLQQGLERAGGRPGVARARRVVAFADGRSESAGESHSRVVLDSSGLAPTSLQHRVLDHRGREIARCDCGCEASRTIGEFDGLVKYGRLLKPGQTAADVVYAEKRREDGVRDAGWQVVRWSWSDLQSAELLADQLRRAFHRGSR